MIQVKDKLDLQYAVKGNPFDKKEVDMTKRTVDLIANTYLWFDSDQDVLVPGCAKKSIEERGPDSNAAGKIKHLMSHKLDEIIARPTLIEETTINGKNVLHCNSFFPESEDSENALINYQSDLYDQHSIGFRYMNIVVCVKDTSDEDHRRNWDEWIAKIINPKDAEEVGYMFIVKELALYEYSTVAFGANRLTPYLGSKSDNKNVRYQNIVAKLDALIEASKTVNDKEIFELKERQLKQMLYEIMTEEPFQKPPVTGPGNKNTPKFDFGKAINDFKIFQNND